jgi:hypothetical protein
MNKGREHPPLAAAMPPAHERVAPVEASTALEADIHPLNQPRPCERNHRIPETLQLPIVFNLVPGRQAGLRSPGRGVDLLRCL